MKKNETEKWLSIKLFIDRFQQISQYVIVSIVAAPDLKARIEMIEFFIFVAEHLLKLNNLYSFMSVLSALDSVSVQKLKISWDLVNKSMKRKYKEFLSPLSSGSKNYKLLREYAKDHQPPGIPFLGILLKDLTVTNDQHRNKLPEELDKHINFKKYVLFYRIINENINKYLHSEQTYSTKMHHSKQFESQDINALFQQLNVEDLDDVKNEQHLGMNIIPDIVLQEDILKSLNSYILLSKDVVRAMTDDANRGDAAKRDEYIAQYLKKNNKTTKKRLSFTKASKNALKSLFLGSQTPNSLRVVNE